MSFKKESDISNIEHEDSPINAKRIVRVDGSGNTLGDGPVVTNAIDQIAFDLNAAAFNTTTNLSNDYIFDSVLLNFSTAESKTITITGQDGTILLGGTVDTSSQNLLRNTTNQNFNLIFKQAFNANDNITVEVTQFSSAGTMDCILKVLEGTSFLSSGNPVLGAGTSIIGTTQEYFHQIALGNVANNEAVTIVAQNDAVGTTEETVWEEGGIYTFPSSATTMTLSSSSANDTSAGTGLRTVTVDGLDTNHAEITEVVTLSGQTGVTTTNSYLRVNRITGSTAGSTKSNEGTLYIGTGTITAGKPANVFNLIEIGSNISHSGFFTVPAGKTFYIPSAIISVESGKFVEITLVITAENGIPLQINQWDISGSVVLFNTQITQSVVAKTDVEFRATNSTGGGGDSKVKETFYGILTG